MPSEAYWLQVEAEARETARRAPNPEPWTKLADLYRENAEEERKRGAGQGGLDP